MGVSIDGLMETDVVNPELGLIVTKTESFKVHPLLVEETVYQVVEEGVAIGFGILGLLNPVVGVQE